MLQALVDHQYRFLNVYVGWSGSVHDACILSNSEKGESETLVSSHIWTLGGVPVPVVILGDPAYPLLPWLLKPYQGVGLSDKQKFNRRLSRACVVVEYAFRRLKGGWRSLLKRKDMKLGYLCTAVTVCCILHNICCEVHHDEFDEQWLDDVDESSIYPQAVGTPYQVRLQVVLFAML